MTDNEEVRRAAFGYLFVCIVVTAGYGLAPNVLAKNICFDLFGVVAVGALLVGLRRNGEPWRLPWLILAASQLLFAAGDVTFTVYARVAPDAETYPADVGYLARYSLLTFGLLLLVRRRAAGRCWPSLLDAAIVTVGLAAPLWQFVMGHGLSAAGLPLAAAAVVVCPSARGSRRVSGCSTSPAALACPTASARAPLDAGNAPPLRGRSRRAGARAPQRRARACRGSLGRPLSSARTRVGGAPPTPLGSEDVADRGGR